MFSVERMDEAQSLAHWRYYNQSHKTSHRNEKTKKRYGDNDDIDTRNCKVENRKKNFEQNKRQRVIRRTSNERNILQEGQNETEETIGNCESLGKYGNRN